MSEFWESSFREKREMWGFEPADSAISTADLFRKEGLGEVLIPGFGYGRDRWLGISRSVETAHPVAHKNGHLYSVCLCQ